MVPCAAWICHSAFGYILDTYPIWIHIAYVVDTYLASIQKNSNKSDTWADPYWVTIAHHWICFGPTQMLTRPSVVVHGAARRDDSVAAPGRERSEDQGKGERGAGGNSMVPSSTRSPVAAGLLLMMPTWGVSLGRWPSWGDRAGEALVEEEAPGRSWWQWRVAQGRRHACGTGEACMRAALGRRWAEQGCVRHKYEV
jgi:hypothetical protein